MIPMYFARRCRIFFLSSNLLQYVLFLFELALQLIDPDPQIIDFF